MKAKGTRMVSVLLVACVALCLVFTRSEAANTGTLEPEITNVGTIYHNIQHLSGFAGASGSALKQSMFVEEKNSISTNPSKDYKTMGNDTRLGGTQIGQVVDDVVEDWENARYQVTSGANNQLVIDHRGRDKLKEVNRAAYVTFSVPISVPAHTERTVSLEFQLDGTRTESSPKIYGEIVAGAVPDAFTLGTASARSVLVVHSSSDFSQKGTYTTTLTNSTGTDQTSTLDFVVFVGHGETNEYYTRAKFTMSLNQISYTDNSLHNFTYSSSGDTITESCTCGHSATATISAPETVTYTGSAITPAQVTYSDNWQGSKNLEIHYTGNTTNVGTATASISIGGASTSVNFTITPKTVGLEWHGDTDLVYDGNPKNVTATATGVVSGDTCTVTVGNGTQTNAGTYTATATGLSNSNYRLPDDVERSYTIAKAAGRATVSMEGWTYDATAKNQPVPTSETNGTQNVTYHYTGTDGYDSDAIPTGAGSYTVTATFAATDNYNAVTATAQFAIAKATPNPITPTGLAATYGDKLSDVGLTEGWSWNDGNSPVGNAGTRTHTAIFTPADTANYTTVTRELSVEIAKKQLVPTVIANSKEYDGNTSAAGTITLTGAVLGDQPTAIGTFHFVDANAGTDKDVNASVTLGDGWDSNYVLSQTTLTAAADIAKKTVGLTWSGYADLVYDGQPVSVTAQATGVVTGDACTVTVDNGTQTNADTYTAAATGLSNSNYQLPEDVEWSYTIAPLPVKLSWSASNFTYDKSEKEVTATVTNKVEGDAFSLSYTGNTGTDADSYQAEVTDLGNDNYTLTGGTGLTHSWTIGKAVVSFTVSGDSHTYDGTAKTAAVTQEEGQTAIPVHGYTVTYGDKASQTNAGTYNIIVTLADDNFCFESGTTSSVVGQLVIAKAMPELTMGNVTITYGAALEDSLLQGSAASSGQTVPGTFAWGDSKTGTHPTVAQSGVYTVVFTPSDTHNYNSATTTITLTVNKATLTPTVGSVDDKIYDGNTGTAGTITLTGAVLGDQPTAIGTFHFVDANAGTDKDVNASVTLGDGWDSNYVLSQTTLTAAADITPKTVGLTWSGYEDLVYDGQPVSVTAQATGVVTGDACTVTVDNGTQTNADTYTAAATGLSNSNYQLPEDVEWSYTIAPLPVKLSWSASNFTYDKSEKEVTATVTNKVEGDAFSLTYTGNTGTDAHSYQAEVTGLGNDNYTLTGGTGLTHSWTIGKAVVSFTVSGDGHTYDGTAKTAAVTQEEDQTAIPVHGYTVTYGDKASQTNAGIYDVTVTISDPNFCFAGDKTSAVVGRLTIGKKTITGTWQGLNQVYGDGETVSILLDGLVEADQGLQAVITGGGEDVGSYELTATLDNYAIINGTATLVVRPKPVVVTVTNNAVTAGEEPQINVPGLEENDYQVIYKDRDGNEIADLSKPGTYEVWVEITDPNYRHPDGSSEKQVGTVTVTSGTPTLYAVTFDGGEGATGSTDSLKVAGGSVITLPECGYSRVGYQFTGWKYNGRTYQPGDSIAMPYGAVTFEAQWAKVRNISGIVTDAEGKTIQDAVVSIWQGANKLDEKTTDANGGYTFNDLAPGDYNISVTVGGKTITSTISVAEDGTITGGTISLPEYDTTTKVEVTPGSPDIVVDGLNDIFNEKDKDIAENGGKVEITIKVDQKQESDLTANEEKQLDDFSGSASLGLYVDLSVDKTTTPVNGGTSTESGITAEELLTIIIPLPGELQDKYSYTVVRTGDETGEQIFTTPDKDTGEFYELSEDRTSIILHVKESAIYGVGYNDLPAIIPYPPIQTDTENGSFTVTPAYPGAGQIVTITPKPDEGYTVDAVTVVDQNNKKVEVTPNADGTYSFTQPFGRVTITVTFKEVTGVSDCPRDETCPMAQFSDVDRNAWYHDGVHYCVEEKLLKGTGNGTTFSPAVPLNRAMLMTILARLDGADTEGGDTWYAKGLEWAVANGISDGTAPERDITRQELMTMLYRYAGSPAVTGSLTGYPDGGDVADWAEKAMAWSVQVGLLKGDGAGRLNPNAPATRMEAATILMRFCENVLK